MGAHLRLQALCQFGGLLVVAFVPGIKRAAQDDVSLNLGFERLRGKGNGSIEIAPAPR